MRYLVIGASGHGQEVAWSLREQARARGEPCALAFYDDAVPRGPVLSGLGDVVGRVADARAELAAGDARLVLGVGLPQTKATIAAFLACPDELWATVAHPTAVVGPNVALGAGSYVGPGAVLTVNVRIGRFATVNAHCLAAHGATLEDYVSLHPDVHLSGEVHVGEGAELGAGSVVIPGVRLGAWAVLGAGCVAVRDLGGSRTWVGVPASELRRHDALGEIFDPVLEAR
jgi:sugar O-acyltransferase (sialic acid O-acetyltransferase NeuD family)